MILEENTPSGRYNIIGAERDEVGMLLEQKSHYNRNTVNSIRVIV